METLNSWSGVLGDISMLFLFVAIFIQEYRISQLEKKIK